jgi:hypothetical protein
MTLEIPIGTRSKKRPVQVDSLYHYPAVRSPGVTTGVSGCVRCSRRISSKEIGN